MYQLEHHNICFNMLIEVSLLFPGKTHLKKQLPMHQRRKRLLQRYSCQLGCTLQITFTADIYFVSLLIQPEAASDAAEEVKEGGEEGEENAEDNDDDDDDDDSDDDIQVTIGEIKPQTYE